MAVVTRPQSRDISGSGISNPIPDSALARTSVRRRLGIDVGVAMLVGFIACAAASIGITSSLWADELWSVGLARQPLSHYL
jgi:hypothetical protein